MTSNLLFQRTLSLTDQKSYLIEEKKAANANTFFSICILVAYGDITHYGQGTYNGKANNSRINYILVGIQSNSEKFIKKNSILFENKKYKRQKRMFLVFF